MKEKQPFKNKSFVFAFTASVLLFLVFIAIDAYKEDRILTHIVGLDGFIFARGYLIAAVIFLLFKKTRMIAAALFLSAGFMLLIGYTCCSFPVMGGTIH